MEKIIRKDPFSILLYQDECRVQVGGSTTRIWSIKGKTAQTVSSGKRANVKIIGTVNFHSGDVFAMELENYLIISNKSK